MNANPRVPYANHYSIETGRHNRDPGNPIEINMYAQLPYTAGTDGNGNNTRWVRVILHWFPGQETASVTTAFPVSGPPLGGNR